MAEDAMRVANKALTVANTTQHRINTHERLCAEKHERNHEILKEIKNDIGDLFNRWWIVVIATIGGLLSLVGFLLVKVLDI